MREEVSNSPSGAVMSAFLVGEAKIVAYCEERHHE